MFFSFSEEGQLVCFYLFLIMGAHCPCSFPTLQRGAQFAYFYLIPRGGATSHFPSLQRGMHFPFTPPPPSLQRRKLWTFVLYKGGPIIPPPTLFSVYTSFLRFSFLFFTLFLFSSSLFFVVFKYGLPSVK